MGERSGNIIIDRDTVVAVTGATGMLGGEVIRRLADTGCMIRLVARDAVRCQRLAGSLPAARCEVVETELVDPHGMREAFAGVDIVFNCAAAVSFQVTPEDDTDLIAVNTAIAHHVVNTCLDTGLKRLIHVSSVAALGSREGGRTDETSYPDNLDGWNDYAVSKYYSENEVWRGIHRGLDAVIVNPSVILGSGDWKGHGSPSLFDFFARGIPFYTAGVTGYVDVADVARAMLLLAVTPGVTGRRFILSAENLSYRELIGRVAESVGKKKPKIEMGEKSLRMTALASKMLARLTGGEQKITDQIIHAAVTRCYYDGSAVTSAIDFGYTPIDRTIARIAADYLKENGK